MPHEASTVRVDGHRLEVARWGAEPGTAPTVVLLHEGLGCVSLWRELPARLATALGYGVLAFSRVGHGRSDPCTLPRPVSFMHHEGLEVLPRVLAATGVGEHVLLGQSDGASIALINAGGAPGAGLRGVIAEAPHIRCEEQTRAAVAAAGEAYRHGDLHRRLERHHGDRTACAFQGWHDVWLHPKFQSWSIEEYLPRIQVPVLVLQGDADPYGSQVHMNGIAAAVAAPVETLLLPGCGHAPHRERTDDVETAITSFVHRCCGAAGAKGSGPVR